MSSYNILSDEIRRAEPVVVTGEEKIAYQGIKGANSYEAAQRLFPESDLTAYKSFEDVFKAVENGECGYGVLPVENSTAGSVAAVYDLILRYRLLPCRTQAIDPRRYRKGHLSSAGSVAVRAVYQQYGL